MFAGAHLVALSWVAAGDFELRITQTANISMFYYYLSTWRYMFSKAHIFT